MKVAVSCVGSGGRVLGWSRSGEGGQAVDSQLGGMSLEIPHTRVGPTLVSVTHPGGVLGSASLSIRRRSEDPLLPTTIGGNVDAVRTVIRGFGDDRRTEGTSTLEMTVNIFDVNEDSR